ncbi:hypothetical protein LOD99_3250 [Oopsacas minuta]|uniref:Uncharacterized protein n=1 Tax=Oopsacas minuta TaxID=111878 RepID=A0AAV7JYI9_9METZ|nr:hypothetical protein LOD99_3250 [Oopsacas minuta]
MVGEKYQVDENRVDRRVPTGLYGWRKRIFYLAVIVLLCLILVNLGLTIWILTVLRFNIHGIGSIRFIEDRLIVEGQAEFLQGISTRIMSSNGTEPLVVNSGSSILLQVANTSLNISQDSMEIVTDKFDVGNDMSVTNNSVIFNSKVYLNAGASTDKLYVDTIESEPGIGLSVGTVGNSISIEGDRVDVISAIGDVSVQANDKITLSSSNGNITLESENIFLSNLPIVNATDNSSFVNNNVMEVCVCAGSKKVFLLPTNLTMNCAAADYCQ